MSLLDSAPAPTPEAPSSPSLVDPSPGQTNTPPPTPTQEAPDTPSTLGFRDLLGEDGSFRQDAPWKDVLTPLQVEKYENTFKKYKTPEDLLRAMGHQTSLLGVAGEKITVPKDDSPESVKVAFREALGIPETPDGYGLKKPDALPEGVEWREDYVGKLAEVFHKHNAPPALVKELMELDLQDKAAMVSTSTQESEAQALAAREAGMADLKEAWGNDTDVKIKLAARMAIKEGIDPNDPALAHPATVKLLAKMAAMTSEDQLPVDAADQKTSLQSEAHRIMTDPGHPDYARYHSGTDPGLMKKDTTDVDFSEVLV